MGITFLLFSLMIICSCTSVKKYEPRHDVVYFDEIGNVRHEIRFLDESKLKITQIFDCAKLIDSLRIQEILVKYEMVRAPKIRASKNSKKIQTYEFKLINLSNHSADYPIVENDSDCLFLNEFNREDRTVLGGKFQHSTFRKLNIIDFRESSLFLRTPDTTIAFATKIFRVSNE